jgi:4-hydroxy-3-methylbut-2-en-1-yl diphosphate reductase
MSELLIAVPLRLEALLVRSIAGGVRVHTTGMGPHRARAAARGLLDERGDALLVLGFCGGLDEQSRPGEVVVAEEVLAAEDEGHRPERVICQGVEELGAAFARSGLRVRGGPVVCVSRLALGERRAQLRKGGAIAVDMESVWLAAGAGGRPFGVVRVVLDSPTHELLRPQAAVGAVRAARALRRAAATALHEWAPGG